MTGGIFWLRLKRTPPADSLSNMVEKSFSRDIHGERGTLQSLSLFSFKYHPTRLDGLSHIWTFYVCFSADWRLTVLDSIFLVFKSKISLCLSNAVIWLLIFLNNVKIRHRNWPPLCLELFACFLLSVRKLGKMFSFHFFSWFVFLPNKIKNLCYFGKS